MVKASPTSAFEVTKPDFLFQFEIIALDTPAEFRHVHEMSERHGRIQCREPEFRRRLFVVWPFDQQPLLGNRLRCRIAIMGRTHPDAGEASPDNRAFEPSRHVIFRQLLFGRLSASCSTLTGLCASSRTGRTARRPRPEYACGGNAAVPDAHTFVVDLMPAT